MDDSCDLFVLFKQYPSGGTVWLMLGLETTGSDYDDILAIAECMAESGHEVKVLSMNHIQQANPKMPSVTCFTMAWHNLTRSYCVIAI